MKIIAHRGASREFPENTLRAFRRALEIGVDAIETDLVETRDGVIVLHHDLSVLCGLGRVPIKDVTLVELLKINSDIPSLDEVLEELAGQVPFCLELKTEGLAERVVQFIQKYSIASETHFTSFKTSEVLEVKKIFPEAEYSWTYLKLPDEAEQDLKRAGIRAVSLSCEGLSREIVQRLHEHGIKTRVYTVNDVSLAAQFESWGVDAIFTDDPAGMQIFRNPLAGGEN